MTYIGVDRVRFILWSWFVARVPSDWLVGLRNMSWISSRWCSRNFSCLGLRPMDNTVSSRRYCENESTLLFSECEWNLNWSFSSSIQLRYLRGIFGIRGVGTLLVVPLYAQGSERLQSGFDGGGGGFGSGSPPHGHHGSGGNIGPWAKVVGAMARYNPPITNKLLRIVFIYFVSETTQIYMSLVPFVDWCETVRQPDKATYNDEY